jgi:hypothetical protein
MCKHLSVFKIQNLKFKVLKSSENFVILFSDMQPWVTYSKSFIFLRPLNSYIKENSNWNLWNVESAYREECLSRTEQKNRRKSFKSVCPKIELRLSGFNRETGSKISVEDLTKRKVCARFVPHLLNPDQKHKRAASSVEIVEMTDNVSSV